MTNEKFTPGDWLFDGKSICFKDESGEYNSLAKVDSFSKDYKEEEEANGYLLAAAPTLYLAGKSAKEQMHIGLSAIQKLIEARPENEALKRMEAEMMQAIEQISAALSKARGEK